MGIGLVRRFFFANLGTDLLLRPFLTPGRLFESPCSLLVKGEFITSSWRYARLL